MRNKRVYLPYVEARDFVRSLGFKSTREWDKYSKTDRPLNIPGKPNVTYKNRGWVSWMSWLGYTFLRNDRRYRVNDNYFKKWSSNVAYIFGFWFADGCITKNNIFSIKQHKKDKYLLEAMLKEMGSNYPLHEDSNCCTFAINSKTIYTDIIRLGGKERKSLDVGFPYIPKKYLSDFVRGLWDGDGCICYNKQGKSYVSHYVSGSKKLINGLYVELKKNIPNLNGSVYCESINKYCLRFSKNDTIRLKKFMYRDLTAGRLMLKRKYYLFQKTEDFYTYEFLDYSDAQKVAALLDIKSCRQWTKDHKKGKIPHNIPGQPHIVYKNSGWVDWYDWLGKSKNQEVIRQ